jgi:hypothetical protein
VNDQKFTGFGLALIEHHRERVVGLAGIVHEARKGAFLIQRRGERIDRGLIGEIGLMRAEFLLRMRRLQLTEHLLGFSLG